MKRARDMERRAPSPARWERGLHLVVLSAFALAQPLFDLLARDAAFFVVRRTEPIDFAALVVALTLVAPAILWVLELLVGLLNERAGEVLHTVLIALLTALFAAAPLARATQASLPGFAAALAIGATAGPAYARLAPLRSFLTLLSPAPLVFAGLFLFAPSIARLRSPAPESQVVTSTATELPPVVFVIFDELPVTSLMSDDLGIDANLFPNFARLAGTATWFRNATTNHERTEYAIPTILTGELPSDPAKLPTLRDYPRNVFTLLGGSYGMNVHETFTSLCPAALTRRAEAPRQPLRQRLTALASDLGIVYGHMVLPRQLKNELPDISNAWSDFARSQGGAPEGVPGSTRGSGPQDLVRTEDDVEAKQNAARSGRSERFLEFVQSIDRGTTPTFHFLHMLIPHGPWNRLRSGRKYDPSGLPETWAGRLWPDDVGHTALAFQRHLMHLGHVDALLGSLLTRLEEQQMFDDALIVLVADHGISFQPGDHGRQVFERNVRRIAHIPLFVKAPGQTDGRIDDRNAETIDVLPTIASAVGIAPPWKLDGVDLLAPDVRRAQKTVYRRLEPLRLEPLLPARWPELELESRLFGKNRTWRRMYAVGGQQELLGRPVSELARSTNSAVRVKIDAPRRFAAVDTSSADVPCHVTGELFATRGAALPQRVVIGLNGVVRAAGYTLEPHDGKVRFALLVPPVGLRDGANEITVLGVQTDGSLTRFDER